MNYFSFIWTEPVSPETVSRWPRSKISVQLGVAERPIGITFWNPAGLGLQIWSEIEDIAERTEVGVLAFSLVSESEPDEIFTDFEISLDESKDLKKMVIEESGSKCESGLCIETMDGREIIIVAGVYPYSLAIKGVISIPYIFEPEYDLDRYDRFPFP